MSLNLAINLELNTTVYDLDFNLKILYRSVHKLNKIKTRFILYLFLSNKHTRTLFT